MARSKPSAEKIAQTRAAAQAQAEEVVDTATNLANEGIDKVKESELRATLQNKANALSNKATAKVDHLQSLAGQAKDAALQQYDHAKEKANELEVRAEQKLQQARTWVETLFGDPYSLRRTYAAYCLAFWTSTIIRQICLHPSLPVFGKHLSQTLAPIERDDVSWFYIALTKAIDLAMAVWVYSSEGSKVDAPSLGVLLCLISRPTLYQFFHHHFLLSTKTVTEVLLTDVFAGGAAMLVLSKLLPAPPTFRPQPATWIKRHLNLPSLLSIGLALGLGTLLSALIEFVSDRTFLHQTMKAGLLDHSVPSYFSADRPASAFAMAHPLLAIPTLRNDFQPLSMLAANIRALPFTISFLALAIFVVPQIAISKLCTAVFLLTTPAAFFTLWNLLPVTASSAAAAAVTMGARQAVVAFVMALVLDDLRRPVEGVGARVSVTTTRVVGKELDGTRLIEEREKEL